MKKIYVQIILILGVVFVSTSSVIIKASSAPSLIIAFYRMTFTVMFMLPLIYKHWEEIKRLSKRQFFLSTLSGIFLGLHFATWITSLSYTSVASSTVLVNTHTIFILMGSVFILHEPLNKKLLPPIFIAIIGSIIISLGDFTKGSNIFYGDMLAILGAIFVAGYMLIGRLQRRNISSYAYTLVVYASSAVTLLILIFIQDQPLTGYSSVEWGIFIALALFCTLLGHSVFSWALGYLPPTFVSISILGEPIYASVWAFIFFKETVSLTQIAGSILILLGLYKFIKISNKAK